MHLHDSRTRSPRLGARKRLSHTQCSCAVTKQMSLLGKVVAITASTDGIGLAIAKRLARDGANIVVSSRKEQNVEKTKQILRNEFNAKVEGVTCHVAKQSDRKALLDCAINSFGRLDILVSNAAVNPAMGQFLDTSEEEFEKVFKK